MAIDLGYNKQAGTETAACSRPGWSVLLKEKSVRRDRTMEEHRAILGVYWLNST
jgi:hypothetical protein